MYLSVTSENCSTSPVFNSVFDRRIDLMNPPNSAPITSRGTPPGLMLSTLIPSSPIRLTASAPSTRSRIPSSTSLNDTPLLPLFHLGQPLLELDRLRMPRRAFLARRRTGCQCVEFSAHVGVVGLTAQDGLIDLARLLHEALPDVEVCHRHRIRQIFGWRRRRRCFGRSKDVRSRFFVRPWRRNLCPLRSRLDMNSRRLFHCHRCRAVVFDRLLEWAFAVGGTHRLAVRGDVSDMLLGLQRRFRVGEDLIVLRRRKRLCH